MHCLQCPSGISPEHARFCASCGAVIQQMCPYEDCLDQNSERNYIPLSRENPPNACPHCKQFLLHCKGCNRLYPLESRHCETGWCVNGQLAETFEPWTGFAGHHNGRREAKTAHRLTGNPGERRWDTVTASGPVHALAYGHGHLVWCEDAHCVVQAFSRFGPRQGPEGSPVVPKQRIGLRGRVPAQLAKAQLYSASLLVEFARVFALTEYGVESFDLTHLAHGVQVEIISGRFFHQMILDEGDEHVWLGFSQEGGKVWVHYWVAGPHFPTGLTSHSTEINFSDWRGAVALGNRVFVYTTGGILELIQGEVRPFILGQQLGTSPVWACVHKNSLLVLTIGGESRLWRLGLEPGASLDSVRLQVSHMDSSPVVIGDSFCVWDNAPGGKNVVIYDLSGDRLDHSASVPRKVPFQGGAIARWGVGLVAQGDGPPAHYLLYGLSEGQTTSINLLRIWDSATWETATRAGLVRPTGVGYTGNVPVKVLLADGLLIQGVGGTASGGPLTIWRISEPQ